MAWMEVEKGHTHHFPETRWKCMQGESQAASGGAGGQFNRWRIWEKPFYLFEKSLYKAELLTHNSLNIYIQPKLEIFEVTLLLPISILHIFLIKDILL